MAWPDGGPERRYWTALTVLAFVAPAVLLGIGLIALWNRPATAFVYGGVGMIVVGYIGRYAVVGLRTLTVIIAQSSPHLEESAATAGAGTSPQASTSRGSRRPSARFPEKWCC